MKAWFDRNGKQIVAILRNATIALWLAIFSFGAGAGWGVKWTYDTIVHDGKEISEWLTKTGISLRAASSRYPQMEYRISVIDEDIDAKVVEEILEKDTELAQKVLAKQTKKK